MLAGTEVKPLTFCDWRTELPHALPACTPIAYNEPLGLPNVIVTLGVAVVNGDIFKGLPLK
jgi:hypothetical protein